MIFPENGTFKGKSKGCVWQVKNGRKKKKDLGVKGFETRELAWQLGGVEGQPSVWGGVHTI